MLFLIIKILQFEKSPAVSSIDWRHDKKNNEGHKYNVVVLGIGSVRILLLRKL